MNRKTYKSVIPSELENVATTSDIDALDGKLGKCYSTERYEEFQGAVEKIVGRYLKSTVGWAILLWIISLIGSMLLQKFTNLF